MTTEPEARAFLTELITLAQALDDAILDSGMPAASGENAGIARALPKSKSPCSDSLGDMRRDALAYIQPWVGNLSSDLTIRQPDPATTDLAPWIRWLHRHRVDLIARPWWPTAEEELRERVHRPLADQFTPPESTRPQVSDWPTVSELAAVARCTEAAMHKRLQRAGIKPYGTLHGESIYQREVTSSVI